MNKTLYLHIGSYKTGSTSIQNFLFRNRDRLLAEDFFYLFSDINGCAHTGQQVAHRRLSREELKSYLLTAESQNHILSDECLYNNRLRNKKDIIETLLFSNIYSDVRILCYVRRQDIFVESFYKQELKTGMEYVQGLGIYDFVDHLEKTGSLKVSQALSPWENAAGESSMNIKVFERNFLKNHDIIDDFLQFLPVEGKTLAKPPKMNESITDCQAALLSLFYKSFKDLHATNITGGNRSRLLEITINSSRDFDYRGSLIPASLKDKLIAKYYSDNLMVGLKYGIPKDSQFMQHQSV